LPPTSRPPFSSTAIRCNDNFSPCEKNLLRPPRIARVTAHVSALFLYHAFNVSDPLQIRRSFSRLCSTAVPAPFFRCLLVLLLPRSSVPDGLPITVPERRNVRLLWCCRTLRPSHIAIPSPTECRSFSWTDGTSFIRQNYRASRLPHISVYCLPVLLRIAFNFAIYDSAVPSLTPVRRS
jgi:hypothetical protein